jgi:RNA polymerase subunit RPABC4/transcription elongation factor Spt4
MSKLRSELSLIPVWARIIALVLVVGAPVGMTALMQLHESHPPPIPFSVAFGLFMGSMMAVFVLAMGYVNRDAKRRGMSSSLWTLVVVFVPNGLGFLIYFLMREPLRSPCPSCGQLVQPAFNYCPNCHHALKPLCTACGKALAAEHAYCPYCGGSTKTAA